MSLEKRFSLDNLITNKSNTRDRDFLCKKEGWDSCKEKILQIIEKNTNTNLLSAADYDSFMKMLREIKKL